MSSLDDVVVIGAGPAGRIAALEAAKLSLKVRLLANPEQPSGALASGEIGAVAGLDLAAESFSASGHAAKLATELGLETEALGPRRTRLRTRAGAAVLPSDVRGGVPGNPFAPELRPLLKRSLFRAYADRVMPFLRIGEERNLAVLVESRLGSGVLDSLTRPFTRAVWGLEPEQLDADRAIPGVNAALTRLGSLQGAIASLDRGERADLRFVGGAGVFASALETQLRNYAVELSTVTATSLAESSTGWIVGLSDGAVLRARSVIVACDPAGLGLARPTAIEPLDYHRIMLTALVRWPVESAAPADPLSGVLIADGAMRSLVRASKRSADLSAQLEPGMELLRASVAPELLADADPAELFTEVIERELGPGAQLLEMQQRQWTLVRPWLASGDPEPGVPLGSDDGSMEVAGQWIAGPGLDAALRSGHDVAHRVRRVALARRADPDSAT